MRPIRPMHSSSLKKGILLFCPGWGSLGSLVYLRQEKITNQFFKPYSDIESPFLYFNLRVF